VTSKRSFGLALAGCVVGAGLALLAGSRTWETTSKARPAPLPPTSVTHSGNSVVPWLLALSLVGLAGAGALLATRGAARRVVGGVIALAGVGVVAAAVRGISYTPGWPVLALLGGLAILACGMLAIVRGDSWPAMGAKYERGAVAPPRDRPATQATMWDDLDRGVDPTRSGEH
jgi:hypothetical protein